MLRVSPHPPILKQCGMKTSGQRLCSKNAKTKRFFLNFFVLLYIYIYTYIYFFFSSSFLLKLHCNENHTTDLWTNVSMFYLSKLGLLVVRLQRHVRTDMNSQHLTFDPPAGRPGWVNPSKRGGMDGVFQGLAGLLRGISRGQNPRDIPRAKPEGNREELPCQPEENPILPDFFTQI